MLYRHNIPQTCISKGTAITFGGFDGVHVGHQMLIKKLLKLAKNNDLMSIVILFYPSPKAFFSKKTQVCITGIINQYLIMKEMGVDCVLCLKFDEKINRLTGDEFIKEYLIKKLNCHDLVLGEDAKFGFQQSGSIESIKKSDYPFNLHVIQDYLYQNDRMSSSRIRQLIQLNQPIVIEEAFGRKMSYSGVVRNKNNQVAVLIKNHIWVGIGSKVTLKYLNKSKDYTIVDKVFMKHKSIFWTKLMLEGLCFVNDQRVNIFI